MATPRHVICNKEEKIETMVSDLKKLKKVVFEDSNGNSLVTMARQSLETQKAIGDHVWATDSNVKTLMKFQTQVETRREETKETNDKKTRRQQWIVVLLIGTTISLISVLVNVFIHFNIL